MRPGYPASLLCMTLMLSACVNQSIDQSIDQGINQDTDQSVDQGAAAASEPGVASGAESEIDSVGNTVSDSAGITAGSSAGARKPEETVALANPAALHCEEQGHELVDAKTDNGSTLMCVDPATGSKCPVWKYFRGECELPES